MVGVFVPHAGSQSDTTPPAISVVNVHAFIFHLLATVELNEEGTVWCGAILNSGLGTVAPSAVQMKNDLPPVAGRGTSTVSANTQTNIPIIGLSPGTVYDVYCYAEDVWFNGMQPAAIDATKQEALVTASGGDYNRPIFSYVPPFQIVESTTIKVYVKLNEDGNVWCVAKRDTGGGTTEPTSHEIINNIGVDGWATAVIVAQNLYIAGMLIYGLLEGSTYDVYCFAKDVAGNGIDNTPSLTRDTTAITATKRSGIATDTTLIAAAFTLQGPGGVVLPYSVEPATWNPYLPKIVTSGNQERRDLESWNAPLVFLEAWLMSHSDLESRGCTHVPAPPPGFVWLALVRRGGCTFHEKAIRAHLAGYQGLIVINSQNGKLPDMTANSLDAAAKIPSWIISNTDGGALAQAIADANSPLAISVEDVRNKPRLGAWQSDSFGERSYITH